jgi:hypothetical protein
LPRIDGYVDLELIGSGGSAEVFRATDTRFERPVAIKVLRVHLSSDSAQEEFRRECLAIGRVGDHPHIIRVYSAGATEDGQPYLAMALMEGSYASRLPADGLPVEEVLRTGTALCGAVATAHAVGVLHRDIKPENLLRTRHGSCVLADFGVSTVVARTTTQSPLGITLQHAAPEVLEGHPATTRSDVYSLASTLHHLVSGRAPFAGDGDPFAPMQKLRRGDLPRLPEPAERIGLGEVLRKALERDPGERTASAEDLGEQLQRCSTRAGYEVPPIEVLYPQGTPDKPNDAVDRSAADQHTPGPRRARSRVALAGLAALIAVTVIGASLWWPGSSEEAAPEADVLGQTTERQPTNWGSTPDELVRSLDEVLVDNLDGAVELPRSCATSELSARSEERLRSMLDAGAGDPRNVTDLGSLLENCGVGIDQLAASFIGGALDPGTVPAAATHADCVREGLDPDAAASDLALIALTSVEDETIRSRAVTDSLAQVAVTCTSSVELASILREGVQDLDPESSDYVQPSDVALILECIDQRAAAGTLGTTTASAFPQDGPPLWTFLVDDSGFPAPLQNAYDELRQRAAASFIVPEAAVVVDSDEGMLSPMACAPVIDTCVPGFGGAQVDPNAAAAC